MSLFEKVDALMQELVGNEYRRQSAETIRILFNLHNEIFESKEYSTSCGGCRTRVYNKVKDWWLNNNGVKKHN